MSHYEVNPSLSRSSLIVTSKSLWMNSSLKDTLKEYIDSDDPVRPKTKMTLVINEVVKGLEIPLVLKKELKPIVGAMGHELWDMYIDCILSYCTFGEDKLLNTKGSTFLDYVCWTASGCVDIPATLRSLYFAGMLQENSCTWTKLCQYNVLNTVSKIFGPNYQMKTKISWKTSLVTTFLQLFQVTGFKR